MYLWDHLVNLFVAPKRAKGTKWDWWPVPKYVVSSFESFFQCKCWSFFHSFSIWGNGDGGRTKNIFIQLFSRCKDEINCMLNAATLMENSIKLMFAHLIKLKLLLFAYKCKWRLDSFFFCELLAIMLVCKYVLFSRVFGERAYWMSAHTFGDYYNWSGWKWLWVVWVRFMGASKFSLILLFLFHVLCECGFSYMPRFKFKSCPSSTKNW